MEGRTNGRAEIGEWVLRWARARVFLGSAWQIDFLFYGCLMFVIFIMFFLLLLFRFIPSKCVCVCGSVCLGGMLKSSKGLLLLLLKTS